MMTTIGCSSIFLNAAIPIDRYYALKFNLEAEKTYTNFLYGTIASIVLGLVCSVPPLTGWSFYSLEKGLTSCSVEWNLRNWNVSSYNIFLITISFFVPIGLIIMYNVKLLQIVRD